MADQPHDDRDRSGDLLHELRAILERSGVRSEEQVSDHYGAAAVADLAGAQYKITVERLS